MVRHSPYDRRVALAVFPGLVRGHHARGADDGRPKGEKSRPLGVYDVTQRRLIDADITRRAVSFIERQTNSGRPFFAYVALTQPHLPSEPNPAFKGRTGNGGWADMLAEMDANVGRMLDAVDRAGVGKTRSSSSPAITAPNSFVPGTAGPALGAGSTSPPWRVAFACPS